MKDWERDKHWSDQFIPEIKRILGEFLICEAPAVEDRERATDLIVMNMAALQIACRVRKADPYFLKYPNEFTVRAVRSSGMQTELSKFIAGFAHFMFYGFGDADGRLRSWMIGNLNVFRLWFNSELARNAGRPPGVFKKNHDGSSDFYAFDINALPPAFVHARFIPPAQSPALKPAAPTPATPTLTPTEYLMRRPLPPINYTGNNQQNSLFESNGRAPNPPAPEADRHPSGPPSQPAAPSRCPKCNTELPAIGPCPVCQGMTQRELLAKQVDAGKVKSRPPAAPPGQAPPDQPPPGFVPKFF